MPRRYGRCGRRRRRFCEPSEKAVQLPTFARIILSREHRIQSLPHHCRCYGQRNGPTRSGKDHFRRHCTLLYLARLRGGRSTHWALAFPNREKPAKACVRLRVLCWVMRGRRCHLAHAHIDVTQWDSVIPWSTSTLSSQRPCYHLLANRRHLPCNLRIPVP